MPSKFPDRFGSYVLLQPLGRGGMGHVTLAMFGRPGAEQLCVIKRLLPQHRTKPEFLARFRDEAELARRLSHGNLVETYAVGQVDDEPYIAQAFVEGHDLMEVLLKAEELDEPVPLPLAVFIVRELARGLAFAHDFENLRLVHRDISPTNIRLTYGGEVKLLDFGLATSVLKMHMTEPGSNWGKIAYMAPEQISDGALDRRADIFSLGVLLWELLTGDRTRGLGDTSGTGTHRDFASAIAAIATRELPPPSSRNREVPSALDAVVVKAGAPSPERRFATAAELRTALAPFLPAGFDADAVLSNLLSRLFSRQREKDLRDELVSKGRALLPLSSSEVVPVDVPPTLDDRFVLGAQVDGAGQTDLRIARDKLSHRPLLVRTTSHRHDPDMDERLQSISKELRDLRLSNVLSVTELGATTDGRVYFVMDHFGGSDVWRLVASRSATEDQALAIAIEVCGAIDGSAPLVSHHGSIDQPGRVLVSQPRDGEDLKVRILGADIVARAAGLTEQPETDDAAGVGHLLYALLVGARRTDGSSPIEEERPDVSPETRAIIGLALAGDFVGVGDLQDELLSRLAARGQAGTISHLTPSRRLAPESTIVENSEAPSRRKLGRRVMFVGLGLAIAALAGSGVGHIIMRTRKRDLPSVAPAAAAPPVQAPSPPPLTVVEPREARPIVRRPTVPSGGSDVPQQRPAATNAHTVPTPPSHTSAAAPVEAARPESETGGALLEKARQAFLHDDLDGALRDGKKAAAAGAGAEAQVTIGNVYFKRRQYEQAEAAYREALGLDPSDERAARRLERVRTLLGAGREAPPGGRTDPP